MSKLIKHKNSFKYPFSEREKNIWGSSYSFKLKNFLEKLLPKHHKKREQYVKIWSPENKQSQPLSENDFPLIFIVHNGRPLLPSFLDHYRHLGVTRFVCVDDVSNDGTTEYLLKQKDVDIHFSNVRYKDAARSKTWRELLAGKYGKNRWYLNVDVDEFLFTGCNSKMTISEYANILYSQGFYRLPAPMIDMIPGGNLNDAVLKDHVKPWETCPYFDLDGYSGYSKSGGIKLYGGPRKRLWNANAELMKYPLIYWDKHTSMGVSIHSPRPTYRNHAPICGALLHFKIFADAEIASKEALNSKQYFDGSREYKLMYEYFRTKPEKKLTSKDSVRFENEETLINYRMVKPFNQI